jgi:mono/diheme cytochrome c family protein
VTYWKRVRAAAGIGLLGGSILTVSCSGPGGGLEEQAKPAVVSQADRVARGEYLVKVIGCGDCHTPGSFAGAPDMGRTLSGTEYGWVGPWGTTYAKNLTPDSTGLAGWTEEDLVRALRAGTRKDGTPIRPPMPWTWLSNLTDEDAHSIAAYLLSLAPVRHVVPAALPPGVKAEGSTIVFPPPQAWDLPAKKGGVN